MPNHDAQAWLRRVRASVGSPLDVPDRDLLERFRDHGDAAAFAALVGRHGPMVLRLCRRVLGNVADAEDAFQATFLILCRKAASLSPRDSLAGWLHAIAYRAAQKARVAGARQRKHEGRAAAAQPGAPLDQLTLREMIEALDRELARLPDKFRAPLVLCYLEGLTRDEAARRLGWPPGLLKSRLEQARERLGARFASRGLTLPAALAATLLGEAAASAAVPGALLNSAVRAATAFTAGAEATAVSAPVAAITRGVMRDMFLSKFKGVLGVLVVLVGIGAGLVAVRGNASPPAGVAGANGRAKAAEPDDPEIKKLLKMRRDALAEAAKAQMEEYRVGRVTVQTAQEIWRRLLQAELDLASGQAERIAAHLSYFQFACEIDELCTHRYNAGKERLADQRLARAERYAAEIGLRRAGGKPPKEMKPPIDRVDRP
jgi:RNA polymerase sigma factor (sigma-70 family)